MEFNPQHILLYFAPIFLSLIALEWLFLRKNTDSYTDSAQYSFIDTTSNIGLALLHAIGDAIAALVVISIYYHLFDFRLFDIPTAWWAWVALFFLQDFLYYWFHRASHRIRWMWSSHVAHHSSEKLNLSTAFRQSFTYPISGMWVFWLPLIVLGFEPMMVISMVLLNLVYQFWIHTQVVKKLGFFEIVMNTPSHHRVHHSRNEQYIDMNYAGTLIIWDKMFGTFIKEDEINNPCEFGITKQIHTHNPITLTFHEWKDMFSDAFKSRNIKESLQHLWRPPEWQPEETRPAQTEQGKKSA